MLNLQYPVWLIVSHRSRHWRFWGTVNGLIIVITGVSPLIVTLGMMMVLRGFSELLGAGKTCSFLVLFALIRLFYTSFNYGCCLPGGAFILGKTRLGFNTYAIGGNQKSLVCPELESTNAGHLLRHRWFNGGTGGSTINCQVKFC